MKSWILDRVFSEQKAPNYIFLNWVEGLARCALVLSQMKTHDIPSKDELLLCSRCVDVFL